MHAEASTPVNNDSKDIEYYQKYGEFKLPSEILHH
jgi:hypothetical protein